MLSRPLAFRGSALVYGLIIMFAVSIVLTAIISYVTTTIGYTFKTRDHEEALQIAEAGIDYYRWYLAHNVEGKTLQQIQAFWTSGNPYGVASPYDKDYTDPGGGPIGHFQLQVTRPVSGSTIAIIKSTGWTLKYPTIRRTVQVRLRLPSWSEFVVLSNNNIRFGDGTTINGKIFSNGGVHFDGVTNNIVESAVSTYYDNDSDVTATKPGVWTSWTNEYNTNMHAPVFGAGKVFPVATWDFNSLYGNLSFMKSQAQAGVSGSKYFDTSGQGEQIILKADGTYDIRQVRSFVNSTNEINAYNGNWATYTIPDNGLIFVENNVWLEGTLSNKHVTVVAANLASSSLKSVYISHDITYAHSDGSEVLGIISQNDVEITQNSDTDLVIDGAVLSQQGRVGRQYYTPSNCHSAACQDHKNSISLYGAIATNQRYGFAWTDGTGYATRTLTYDNNLLYFPPPYFPTGTQYKLDLWEEL